MPLAVGVEQYPAAPDAVHGHCAWLGVVAFEQVAQCSGLFGVPVDPSVASGAVVRAAHVDDVRGAVPFGVAVCLAAAFPVVVAAAGPFAAAQVSVAGSRLWVGRSCLMPFVDFRHEPLRHGFRLFAGFDVGPERLFDAVRPRAFGDLADGVLLEPLAGDAAPFGAFRHALEPLRVLPVFEPFAHRRHEPVAVLAHGLGVADDGAEQLARLGLGHGRVAAAGDGLPQVLGLVAAAGMANGSASAKASASARLDTGLAWPDSATAWLGSAGSGSAFGVEGATGEVRLGMVRLGPVASFASKQLLRFASDVCFGFASWFASVLLRGLLEALASFCFEAFASRLLRRDSPEATPPACPALALFSLSSLPEVPPNFIRVSASTTIHRPAASAGSSIPAASSSVTCRALPFSERTTVMSNAPSNAGVHAESDP